MEPIVGIDLGTTNSEVAIVRDGQPHVFERGRRPDPAVVRRPVRGRPAARRQGGPQPVGAGPRAHRQVDQAQDGPGRQGQARRPGVSAAGNLGHDPAAPQATAAPAELGPAGQQGGHHRAGLLQRRPAPGDARGRRAGRAGGRPHPQRADRRLADLRPQPARAAAHARLRPRRRHLRRVDRPGRRRASSRCWPATATRSSAATTSTTCCSSTSATSSRTSTASTCAATSSPRARVLRAVEAAKKQLSFHPFARIEEEFIAEKDGAAAAPQHGDQPRRVRGADPAAAGPHDGLRAARPRRRQADRRGRSTRSSWSAAARARR